MAAIKKTPGVYIEEISKFPPSVAAVATAIPAFIGYTKMATKEGEDLTNQPTRIMSLLEYEKYFGLPENETGIEVTIAETTDGQGNVIEETISAKNESPSPHILYYAMQAYFANGGGPCYVVSVGTYADSVVDNFKAGLKAIEKVDETTLIVFPEAQGLPVADDYFSLINEALEQCNELQDRFVIADFHEKGELDWDSGTLVSAVEAFRNGVTSKAVKYGAVYFPNIKTIFDYEYEDSGVTVKHNVDNGDGNGPHNGVTVNTLEATEGALYSRIQTALRALPVVMPPSAAVAGIYARVDNNRGVWKAPANEGILGISGLTFNVTHKLQEDLNVDSKAGKSINAIRAFTGRGILVWGARTLDGNSNEWRYVPVRRFFNMVEESTKNATFQFVFEPNDANTWVKMRAMIENFLLLQWRAGALQGSKPEQAFYVRVGLGQTMTALDIFEGRMNVEIGMAVVRPAEFIILKFSHKRPEA